MLRHLCKTLMIAVVSGSLLMVQTTALAQTTTTDSKGVITSKKSQQFDKISDQDMLTSITMLAGGFVAGRFLAAYRPVTMDVMIAGAAGAAFVAGEVMSNIKFKGTIDDMTMEVEKKSDGTVNEEQIKRLQDLRASYEEAKGATKTKKTLQLAAAVGFGAAAATSTYMAFTEEGLVGTCRAALMSAQGQLAACVPAEVGGCRVCAAKLKVYSTTFEKYYVSRKPPSPSMVKDAQVAADEAILASPAGFCAGQAGAVVPAVSTAVASACIPALKAEIANQVQGNLSALNASIVYNDKMIKNILNQHVLATNETLNTAESRSLIDKGLDLFFPRAEAGWLSLLGLGASTAAAFFLITGTTAAQIDSLMFVPMNRAIAFGLFAGLALMASKSSDNVLGKIDANIKKIDAILNDLNKLANGVKAQNISQQGVKIQTINPAKNTAGTAVFGPTPSPCMTNNSSTNCPALSTQLTTLPGFSTLPDSFKDLASQSVKLGDSLSGSKGISGSSLATAESIGNKQAAVSKLLKDRQEALGKLTNGSFNAAKGEAGLLKLLGAKIRNDLGKKGMTATGMMASIGGTPIDSSLSKVDKKEENILKTNTNSYGGMVDMGSSGSAKDDSLKLDFKEDAPAENLAVAPGGSAPEYDMQTNEIGKDDGPSIFEVISSRYLKSGYPKLLEEEPAKK